MRFDFRVTPNNCRVLEHRSCLIRLYCRARKKLKGRPTRTILYNPGETVVGLAIEVEKSMNSRDSQQVKSEVRRHEVLE